MTIPASSCFRCFKPGTVSDDQTHSVGNTRTHGRDNSPTIRFYCPGCLNVWMCDREQAEANGRFWHAARLHGRGEPPAPNPQVASTPEAQPAPEPSHLHAWRLKELAQVSEQLAGELDAAKRRKLTLLARDLTLLIGTP